MDDGRLTDSHGRTVNFKNAILILTSNIGSPILLEGIDREGHLTESARQGVMEELRAEFRPEFLNRVDDIVLFKPLTVAEIVQIADIQVEELRHRLAQQRIELVLSEAAKKHIAREGYDAVYGARPMKRFIQTHLETPVARKLIAGEVGEGQTLNVDALKGELTFTVK
jgi:ATP-dependent Clp protease ATP-binding subunit ClpB